MRKYPAAFLLAAFLLSLLGVTACANHQTSTAPIVGKAVNSLTGMHDETVSRLSTEANNAVAEGKTNEALVSYSKLYKSNRRNEDVALNYAQLLRKTGKPKEALKILSRFVTDADDEIRAKAKPILLNEYAAANIETGNYSRAEEALNKVLEDENADSFHPDADNLLGLVLDAQNKHKEAEEYYRQALDSWKGDRSAVMNNLGLCLASQGRFDESLTTLRQALILAPHNEEIARNVEMVTKLRNAVVPTAPISVTTRQKTR